MTKFEKLLILFGSLPLVPLQLLLPPKLFASLVNRLPKRFTTPLATSMVKDIKLEGGPEEVWRVLEVGLDKVGYNTKKGTRYTSTEEEVEAALKDAPIFKPYRPYLLRWCERHRKEAGLPV